MHIEFVSELPYPTQAIYTCFYMIIPNEVTEDYGSAFLGKEVDIQIDRPLNSKHPQHGFVYEVNYGFVSNTKAPDGEEVDAYLLCVNEPVSSYRGKCIAVIHRLNDKDDKLIVVPLTVEDMSDEDIRKATEFQERYFTTVLIRNTDDYSSCQQPVVGSRSL
jgi:inorganic pyrophosphatase